MPADRYVTYDQVFSDLRFVYLEDSFVLKIATTTSSISFAAEVVLTPEHPNYHPPLSNQRYCYRRGVLSVRSDHPIEFVRNMRAGARDATGESDLGNIDSFVCIDTDDGHAWELVGEWGSALVARPTVALNLNAKPFR